MTQPFPTHPPHPMTIVFVAGLLCFSEGCAKQGVTGTVIDGTAPVAAGQITFLPNSDTRGPSTRADIRSGRFELDAHESLAPGAYTVRIAVEASGMSKKSLTDKWRGDESQATYETKQEIRSGQALIQFNLQNMHRR